MKFSFFLGSLYIWISLHCFTMLQTIMCVLSFVDSIKWLSQIDCFLNTLNIGSFTRMSHIFKKEMRIYVPKNISAFILFKYRNVFLKIMELLPLMYILFVSFSSYTYNMTESYHILLLVQKEKGIYIWILWKNTVSSSNKHISFK